MKEKEVGKDRDQRGSVTDRFIFIWGIGFLFNSQFGVQFFKVRIVDKCNVAYNTKAVGKDGEFISIAEMLVDVHLFGIRAGGSMGRHKRVRHGVRINFVAVHVKGFEFSDEGNEGFGVVFVDVKLNTGAVKGEDLCQRGINHLADGVFVVHHLFKHKLNIRPKFCLKRVRRGASGTLEKTQSSLNSLHSLRKRSRRESEGMEKIF